jgi:hypothetical protein
MSGPLSEEGALVHYMDNHDGNAPTEYSDISEYIRLKLPDIVNEIFRNITISGEFGRHTDEDPFPWNANPDIIPFINAAAASAVFEVSADMKSFTLHLDSMPEILKYAYQYDHQGSTHDAFMTACHEYPKDEFVVQKADEICNEGFEEFSCIYTNGKFYDFDICEYKFFY